MIANYLTGVSKKVASFDKEYLLVLVLFVIVIFTSKSFALDISSPTQVTVFDKTSFLVEINNSSSKAINLNVEIFSPVKSEVVAPSQVAPNSSVTAKITIYNKYSDERTVSAIIEANSTDETIQKEITLNFKPKTNTNLTEGATKVLSGLFSFGIGGSELSSFTLMDWVIFWVLIIVAAVLVVAFIARVVKRGN